MVGTAAMEHDIEKFDGDVLTRGTALEDGLRVVAEYRGSLRRSPPQEERRP